MEDYNFTQIDTVEVVGGAFAHEAGLNAGRNIRDNMMYQMWFVSENISEFNEGRMEYLKNIVSKTAKDLLTSSVVSGIKFVICLSPAGKTGIMLYYGGKTALDTYDSLKNLYDEGFLSPATASVVVSNKIGNGIVDMIGGDSAPASFVHGMFDSSMEKTLNVLKSLDQQELFNPTHTFTVEDMKIIDNMIGGNMINYSEVDIIPVATEVLPVDNYCEIPADLNYCPIPEIVETRAPDISFVKEVTSTINTGITFYNTVSTVYNANINHHEYDEEYEGRSITREENVTKLGLSRKVIIIDNETGCRVVGTGNHMAEARANAYEKYGKIFIDKSEPIPDQLECTIKSYKEISYLKGSVYGLQKTGLIDPLTAGVILTTLNVIDLAKNLIGKWSHKHYHINVDGHDVEVESHKDGFSLKTKTTLRDVDSGIVVSVRHKGTNTSLNYAKKELEAQVFLQTGRINIPLTTDTDLDIYRTFLFARDHEQLRVDTNEELSNSSSTTQIKNNAVAEQHKMEENYENHTDSYSDTTVQNELYTGTGMVSTTEYNAPTTYFERTNLQHLTQTVHDMWYNTLTTEQQQHMDSLMIRIVNNDESAYHEYLNYCKDISDARSDEMNNSLVDSKNIEINDYNNQVGHFSRWACLAWSTKEILSSLLTPEFAFANLKSGLRISIATWIANYNEYIEWFKRDPYNCLYQSSMQLIKMSGNFALYSGGIMICNNGLQIFIDYDLSSFLDILPTALFAGIPLINNILNQNDISGNIDSCLYLASYISYQNIIHPAVVNCVLTSSLAKFLGITTATLGTIISIGVTAILMYAFKRSNNDNQYAIQKEKKYYESRQNKSRWCLTNYIKIYSPIKYNREIFNLLISKHMKSDTIMNPKEKVLDLEHLGKLYWYASGKKELSYDKALLKHHVTLYSRLSDYRMFSKSNMYVKETPIINTGVRYDARSGKLMLTFGYSHPELWDTNGQNIIY